MDTVPEPTHNCHNKWEENRFQGQPYFGETAVLINYGQVQIANVPDIQVHFTLRIDRQTNIEQIKIVM